MRAQSHPYKACLQGFGYCDRSSLTLAEQNRPSRPKQVQRLCGNTESPPRKWLALGQARRRCSLKGGVQQALGGLLIAHLNVRPWEV